MQTLFFIMINWLDHVYFSLSEKLHTPHPPKKTRQQNYLKHNISSTRPPREQIWHSFQFFVFFIIWDPSSRFSVPCLVNQKLHSLFISTGSRKPQTLIGMMLPRHGVKTCYLKGWKLLCIIILKYVIDSGK